MLDPTELLYAYSQGYFPMAVPEDNNEIFWFKPDMRGIIPLDTFHVSKNLKRLYNKGHFELRINGDFEGKKGRKEYPATFLQSQINGGFEGQ